MINTEQEEILIKVAQLSKEQEHEFWKQLQGALSEQELNAFQICVGFMRMNMIHGYAKAIEEALREEIYGI